MTVQKTQSLQDHATHSVAQMVVARRGMPDGMAPAAVARGVLAALYNPDPAILADGLKAAEYLMAEDYMTWSLRYLAALCRQPEQAPAALARLDAANGIPVAQRLSLRAAVLRCAAAAERGLPLTERLRMADDTMHSFVSSLAQDDSWRPSPLSRVQAFFRARKEKRAA